MQNLGIKIQSWSKECKFDLTAKADSNSTGVESLETNKHFLLPQNKTHSLQYICSRGLHITLFHFAVWSGSRISIEIISQISILNLQRDFVRVSFTFLTICEKQEEVWLPFLLGPRRPGPPGTSPVLWTGWVWKWSQTLHTQSAGSPGSPWSPPQSRVRNKMEQNWHHPSGLWLQVSGGWDGPKIIPQYVSVFWQQYSWWYDKILYKVWF